MKTYEQCQDEAVDRLRTFYRIISQASPSVMHELELVEPNIWEDLGFTQALLDDLDGQSLMRKRGMR